MILFLGSGLNSEVSIKACSQGIVKALYFLPEKVLTLTDVRKAMSSVTKMMDVEHCLHQAETLLINRQVSEAQKKHALGMLAANLILFVVSKRHRDVTTIESIDHAGVLFVEKLREMTGDCSIPCPWSLQQPSTASVAQKPPKRAEKTTSFLDSFLNQRLPFDNPV